MELFTEVEHGVRMESYTEGITGKRMQHTKH